jgi:hypothetical protein
LIKVTSSCCRTAGGYLAGENLMRPLAWAGLCAALFLAAGCATTRVDGKASAEPSSKIESLALVFDDTLTPVPKDPKKPGIYNTPQSMLDNQRKLAIGIRERFPRIFSASGVELQVYTRSSGEERFRQEAAGRRHVLYLTPTGQTYGAALRTLTFTMRAQLTEVEPPRTLWTGSMSVSRHAFVSIDEKLVDEFAVKIVEQLKSGGLIGPGARTVSLRPVENRVQFADNPIQNVDSVPLLNERGRQGYREWLTKKPPRAFAIAEDGSWNSTWGTNPRNADDPKDPAERAIAHCQRRGVANCRLYAVDNTVVWTAP